MGKGYREAPWVFEGSALYQLNLVRASEARKHVPPELKLVSLFGWTLGGVYLARYSDSPAGAFDELVVLAGLVWNAPTSCAWAQRVYVNSKSARDHGVRSVGLPSRLATFAQSNTPLEESASAAQGKPSWWNLPFARHCDRDTAHTVVVRNVERGRRGYGRPVASFLLPPAQRGWAPSIPMKLPSFSGGTAAHPELLHYTCELRTRVRPRPFQPMRAVGEYDAEHPEDVSSVLRGKALLCMEFEGMRMAVPQPEPLHVRGPAAAPVPAGV